MKKCKFCAEEIADEAIKCRHCQKMLTDGITVKQPEVIPGRSLGAKVGNVIGIIVMLANAAGLFIPVSFPAWVGSVGGVLFGLTITDFYLPLVKNLTPKGRERVRILLPVTVLFITMALTIVLTIVSP